MTENIPGRSQTTDVNVAASVVAGTTRVTMEPGELSVAPGAGASCRLTVTNAGDIVDSYTCEVVGEAARWARVEPAGLQLYPGDEAHVTVTFAPPRVAGQPTGTVPFAVRVVPAGRPDGGAAAEGVLAVLAFTQTTADLIPRTSRGWRTARHELAIDNRGNAPLRVAVAAADTDGALSLPVHPELLIVGPGRAAFATVRGSHRRLLWRGAARTRPFQIVVQPENEPTLFLDGTAVQVPIISRLTARLVAFALVAVLLLVAAWFGLFRPTLHSAAREAVSKPLASLSAAAADAARRADAAQQAAEGAASGTASPAPVPPAAAEVTSTPFSRRLEAIAAPGSDSPDNSAARFTVATKTVFVLTDVVMQNPQGDSGMLELLANGKVLLTVSLANFRTEDYHLVSPIEVAAGKVVSISTSCAAPGPPLTGFTEANCRNWVLLSGTNRPLP